MHKEHENLFQNKRSEDSSWNKDLALKADNIKYIIGWYMLQENSYSVFFDRK